jgi:hypothetical protein
VSEATLDFRGKIGQGTADDIGTIDWMIDQWYDIYKTESSENGKLKLLSFIAPLVLEKAKLDFAAEELSVRAQAK